MTQELCRFRHPPVGAMVIWELTRFCNLACLHCCTESSPRLARDTDLSTEAIVRAIQEMQGAGVTEFFFSGGEPLSRSDFAEIVEAVDIGRAEAFVNTNGYWLDHALAERLATSALGRVTISLDGSTPEEHARVRLRRDSYFRALRAIDACNAAGIPVRVSHAIGSTNASGLEQFVEVVVQRGVKSIVMNTIFAAGRATAHPELLLPRTRLAEIEQRLVSLRDQYATAGVVIDFSFGGNEATDLPRACVAGTRVLYVSATGDLSGCSWLYKLDPGRFTVGNLRVDSFADLGGRLQMQAQEFSGVPGCPLPMLAEQRL